MVFCQTCPTQPTLASPGTRTGQQPTIDSEADETHLRGGLSFNGGAIFFPQTAAMPAGSVAVRLGVQFVEMFGLEFQNTLIGTLSVDTSTLNASYKLGFADYSSLLAVLSIAHTLEISGGPSADYLQLTNGNVGLGGSTSSSYQGTYFGTHGRLAITAGAFALGADIHPIFTSIGITWSLTGGIGGEWY